MFCLGCFGLVSVLAKWLARKIPLRKPKRSKGIVSTKLRLKSVYNFLGVLFHCLTVYLSCPLSLHNIFRTPIAWYSLCLLKVPLNTNKPNQSCASWSVIFSISRFLFIVVLHMITWCHLLLGFLYGLLLGSPSPVICDACPYQVGWHYSNNWLANRRSVLVHISSLVTLRYQRFAEDVLDIWSQTFQSFCKSWHWSSLDQ